jgi:endoglucanase
MSPAPRAAARSNTKRIDEVSHIQRNRRVMTRAGRWAMQLLHCAVVGTLVLALGSTAEAESLVTRTSLTDKPDNRTRLGAYDPYGTFANDPRIGIEHVYIPWQDVNLASLNAADRYARERARSLLITVEPWTWSRASKLLSPMDLHNGIMAGQYDLAILALCKTATSLESEVTIRWGHEMDLQSAPYPWSRWRPAEYIDAYRHFVSTCRQVASNIKFMWSPRGEANLQDYYPGSNYVDRIGLTIFGYQKYEVALYGKALTLAERLKSPYELVADYGKDLYITEYGCYGDTGYMKRCIEEGKSPGQDFPKIAGVVYFNEIDPHQWQSYGSPDWRVFSKLFAEAKR